MVRAAGRGLVGAGGELGLRPRGSRCALAACAARSRPDMNSYIKKYEFMYPATYEFIHPYEFIYPMTYEFIHPYEFMYPVTYEFIHPAKCMNSYVSNPCLVYKQNGHSQRRWGGGWSDRNDCNHKLVLGSNPQNLDTIFF